MDAVYFLEKELLVFIVAVSRSKKSLCRHVKNTPKIIVYMPIKKTPNMFS